MYMNVIVVYSRESQAINKVVYCFIAVPMVLSKSKVWGIPMPFISDIVVYISVL